MPDPTDPNRGQRWRDVDAAEEMPASQILLLQSFVRDYPASAGGWRRLGARLADVSRFDEALQALEKARSLAPPDYLRFVYGSLGTLYRERGDDAAAEGWYRRAIDDSPDDTQGYILLGCLLARRGRLTEAEEIHRRATSCTTGHIDEAYLNLGFVLRAQGRYDEALACFQRAMEIDPQYKVARLALRDVKRAAAMPPSPPDPTA